MPEYSTPKLTPAETTKLTGMNSGSSGYFEVKDVLDIIRNTYGQNNGVATLGSDGKLPSSQLPDLADDVIVVASYAVLPAAGTAGKIYITADNNKLYRWDPDLTTPNYVELSVDLSAYATKAELAEEESAREAADSNLLSAIDANSNRISNLEQEHGGYVPVYYRGTNDVPTGKAKYALVESIVGKSRAWNQLANTFVNDSNKRGLTISYDSTTGTISVSGQPTSTGNVAIMSGGNYYAGHKYLLAGFPSGLSGIALGRYIGDGNLVDNGNGVVADATSDGSSSDYIRLQITSTSYSYNFSFKIVHRDLTLIFPDLPSTDLVTSNIPNLVKRCPDLLKYDAFGTSIVDETVSGVKSIGFNRLDLASYMQTLGVSKVGDYYVAGANDLSNLTYNNPFPIEWKPNTRYSFRMTGYCASGLSAFTLVAYYTDGTNETVVILNGQSLTTSTGTSASGKTISKVLTSYGSGGVNNFYLKSLTISIGTDTTKDADYMTDTLSLPSSVTLRSAGEGQDKLELETGIITRQTKEIDLGTDVNAWNYSSTDAYFSCQLPDMKIPTSSYKTRILCGVYEVGTPVFSGEMGAVANMTVRNTKNSSGNEKYILLKNTSKNGSDLVDGVASWLVGVKLVFELEEQISESVTPVIDNTIQTEGGGTINTIQTQTPVIDNSMTVNFDLIP